MNITIDFKTAKTIDSMSQQISHMDNAVTDFFNKMSDVLERQLGDDVPLALCYDPRQVITLAGKRYLSGAVVFVRYDTNGSFVALTTSDLYLIQCYLAENSVPLMAGSEKMVCICID